ncbi:MAG TPA: LPS-assembly protein LptD [Beijerinckiaceae bacterium]|jgi:LPS-assembly protein
MRRVENLFAGTALAAVLACVAAGQPAVAQQRTLNDSIAGKAQAGGKDRLLVEAKELVYNEDKNTVSASGDVELYYQGRTLQADRVTYNRGNNRVYAEGNARLTEADGTVITGDRFELTDDFKNGFIDSLYITQNTVDRGRPTVTRFTAPRAERTEGETTVFERGTYTACEPCKNNPERPPLWQVKAARIIHNNTERTIYYENATLEFLGVPIAYMPYFWTPDPTVKRKTGFLTPSYISTTALGHGVQIPFFWELAPNYDLTFRPTYLSRQGFLGLVEWRHRLLNGSYNIRAAGIFQEESTAFLPSPLGAGDRERRGSLESTGLFYINERWKFGWDVALLSDKWFLSNYKIKSESLSTTYFRESISTVFLNGQGDRSWFDLRGYYFKGLSTYDWQKQQPVVHPVWDYNKRIDGPAPLGGEVSIDVNLTSLTREAAHFSEIPRQNSALFLFDYLAGTKIGLYDTCTVFQRGSCIVRGIAGTSTRLSTQLTWRRNFIDSLGQVWTPFAYARIDGFWVNPDTNGYINNQLPNFISGEEQFAGRAMPAIGLQYRYPLVADAGAFGTQTVEPLAQVIARPNEARIGRLPNEDSQSVIFDDTSIFDWNRFSGYDRVEGGVRADLGIKYSVLSPNGFYADALFGQSFHLAGRNSYGYGNGFGETSDLVNAGRNSGLENSRSDYVGRLHMAPNRTINFTARARFDEETFAIRRFDASLRGSWKPWLPLSTTLTYANYAPQPLLGLDRRREGLLAAANLELTPNWSVTGSVLFDMGKYLIDRETFVRNYNPAVPSTTIYNRSAYFNPSNVSFGVQYADECTTFSVTYSSGVPDNVSTGTKQTERSVLVRLELRTLGQTSFRQTLGDSVAADGVAQ